MHLIFEGESRKQAREHNDRAWLAWHGAALPRAKNFPNLQSLTVRLPTEPQAWEQQREIARLWVVALGGKIESLMRD